LRAAALVRWSIKQLLQFRILSVVCAADFQLHKVFISTDLV